MQHKSKYLDLRLCDNMELMAQYPDKHFELAICDPPYGCAWSGLASILSGDTEKSIRFEAKAKEWDVAPNKEYFKELERVSRNRIIWGYNYLTQHLGNSNNLIIWDKKITGLQYLSRFEIAYCSFNNSVIKQIPSIKLDKFHPTQKPVALYKWLLDKYAKAGDKILDTHLGSGSIAIACHDYKYHLTACELDSDYFAAMQTRVENHLKQTTILF